MGPQSNSAAALLGPFQLQTCLIVAYQHHTQKV